MYYVRRYFFTKVDHVIANAHVYISRNVKISISRINLVKRVYSSNLEDKFMNFEPFYLLRANQRVGAIPT